MNPLKWNVYLVELLKKMNKDFYLDACGICGILLCCLFLLDISRSFSSIWRTFVHAGFFPSRPFTWSLFFQSLGLPIWIFIALSHRIFGRIKWDSKCKILPVVPIYEYRENPLLFNKARWVHFSFVIRVLSTDAQWLVGIKVFFWGPQPTK